MDGEISVLWVNTDDMSAVVKVTNLISNDLFGPNRCLIASLFIPGS